MYKRYFFQLITAIAVLVGVTSCDNQDFLQDKDVLKKTEMKFFRFVGPTEIAICQIQGSGNLYEIERRELELKLDPEVILITSILDEPFCFQEGETGIRTLDFASMYDKEWSDNFRYAPDYMEFTFLLRPVPLSVKLSGYKVSDEEFYCPLDDFILTLDIESLKQIEAPFYQKVKLTYKLITDSKITVAEATQTLELGEKPEGEGEGSGEGEDEGSGDSDEGEGSGDNADANV